MNTLNVPLTESTRRFVENRASSEGFSNVAEYVQALLQRTQCDWEKEQLAAKLQVGIDQLERGEGQPMTQADWDRLHARIAEPENAGTNANHP